MFWLLCFLGWFARPGPAAQEKAWIDLTAGSELAAWREPQGEWFFASDVNCQAGNRRLLEASPSRGPALVNGVAGKTRNLVTIEKFRDVELACEFLLAEKSNSGIKFHGLYEIQLLDSFGKKDEELTGSDCGGIYPRGESLPKYHTIDAGTPPRTNAAKPSGQWQELQVVFQAPRFNGQGVKLQNARFVKVVLNGKVIQENVEVLYATGSAWRKTREAAQGPILLQGDHGPVAFRNLKARPLP